MVANANFYNIPLFLITQKIRPVHNLIYIIIYYITCVNIKCDYHTVLCIISSVYNLV